jgi:hypothetical protein
MCRPELTLGGRIWPLRGLGRFLGGGPMAKPKSAQAGKKPGIAAKPRGLPEVARDLEPVPAGPSGVLRGWARMFHRNILEGF